MGQPEAAQKLIDLTAQHLSGLGRPGRPAGSVLFLGPTGTGKTLAVETLCEGLVGDPRACIKIDCAEFIHSHEIAKLIGSPPGYLGHRETPPLLTQKNIDQWHKEGMKLTVLLFDEIEKASDSLWQLLLGILDKSTLTLGTNEKVNFDNVIVAMTSNLGAKQMHSKAYGFKAKEDIPIADDDRNREIALEAAKKHFTPEFINRLDHIVVFNTLTREQVGQIMNIELGMIQTHLFGKSQLLYQLTDTAKARLMQEGYSIEYGARFLKRAIERLVRLPLTTLIASGQVSAGDKVIVDEIGGETFEFSVQSLRESEVKFKDTGEVLG